MNSGTHTVSIHPSTGPLHSPWYQELVWTNDDVARIGGYSLPTLIAMLRETRSSEAADAIQDRLYDLGADIVPTLTNIASNGDESVRVRVLLLEVAAGIDVERTRDALLSALRDREPRLRTAALEGLLPLLGEDVVRQEIATLADRDPSAAVRAVAVEALEE